MSSRPNDPDDDLSDDDAARKFHNPLDRLDDDDDIEMKVETDGNDATEFTSELDELSPGQPGVITLHPTNEPFPPSGMDGSRQIPVEGQRTGGTKVGPEPDSKGKVLLLVALVVVVMAIGGGGLYILGVFDGTNGESPVVGSTNPTITETMPPGGSPTTNLGDSPKANSGVPTVPELVAAGSDADQLKQLAPLWRQIDELSRKRDRDALTTLKQQIELQRDAEGLPARSKVDYQHMLNDINLELENAATDTNAASRDSAATESISVTTAFMPSPLTLIAMLMIGYADDAQSSEIEAEKLDAEGRQARKDGLYRRAYNNFSDAANLWIGINELNKAVVSVRNAASSNDAIPTRIHQERLSELQQKLDDAHARQSVTEFLRLHDLRSRIAKLLLNNIPADRKLVLEIANREISEIDTRIAGAVTTQLKKDRLSLNGHLVLVAQAEAELSARHLTSITSQVTQLENAALATQRQAVQDAFARRLVERLNALPMPGVDSDQRQTDQELLLRYKGELDGAQLDQLKAVELAERVKSVRDIEARLVEWERTAETVRTKMTKTQLITAIQSLFAQPDQWLSRLNAVSPPETSDQPGAQQRRQDWQADFDFVTEQKTAVKPNEDWGTLLSTEDLAARLDRFQTIQVHLLNWENRQTALAVTQAVQAQMAIQPELIATITSFVKPPAGRTLREKLDSCKEQWDKLSEADKKTLKTEHESWWPEAETSLTTVSQQLASGALAQQSSDQLRTAIERLRGIDLQANQWEQTFRLTAEIRKNVFDPEMLETPVEKAVGNLIDKPEGVFKSFARVDSLTPIRKQIEEWAKTRGPVSSKSSDGTTPPANPGTGPSQCPPVDLVAIRAEWCGALMALDAKLQSLSVAAAQTAKSSDTGVRETKLQVGETQQQVLKTQKQLSQATDELGKQAKKMAQVDQSLKAYEAASEQRQKQQSQDLDSRVTASEKKNAAELASSQDTLLTSVRGQMAELKASPRPVPPEQMEQLERQLGEIAQKRLREWGFGPPTLIPDPQPNSASNRLKAKAHFDEAFSRVFFSNREGSTEAAVRLFSLAVENDPTQPLYRYFLGLALKSNDRADEGLQQVQVGARLEQKSGTGEEINRRLERVQFGPRQWLERIRTDVLLTAP